MPKVKKIRSAALAGKPSRHAPLGQIIQEDENRGKYAATMKHRGGQKKNGQPDDDNDELMEERASKQILELSREQQLEIEREDVQRQQQKRRNQATKKPNVGDDGSDRKSTRLNSSHRNTSRMPSSA